VCVFWSLAHSFSPAVLHACAGCARVLQTVKRQRRSLLAGSMKHGAGLAVPVVTVDK